MDIVCIRGYGLSPGDDIIEILLSDVSAAVSRGRAERDQGALADQQDMGRGQNFLKLEHFSG